MTTGTAVNKFEVIQEARIIRIVEMSQDERRVEWGYTCRSQRKTNKQPTQTSFSCTENSHSESDL